MANKYKKHKKVIFAIVCILQFAFLFSQKNKKLIFKNIPKVNFISSTPDDNEDLNIYMCVNCLFSIEYIRNHTYHNYHDSFKINKKVYEINELLNQNQMDFYNVTYNNKKYLFVSSLDYGSSKYYSLYRHYYLFILNKTNQVVNFKNLPFSKLNKKQAFLKLAE